MAEAALTWSLFLHRNMHRYQTSQQTSQWTQIPYKAPQERSIGILGMGELGQAVAKSLLNNGFNVMGWSRSPKAINNVRSYCGTLELEDMLSQSDIVICLLPLTDATRHLLDAERFAQFKPHAKLINFGRGAVIDDNALLTSLETRNLDHAVLDVFSVEPLPADHRYWSHPNVTVLPHISAQTRPDTASMVVKHNIEQFRLTGELPRHVDFKQGY
jgi:glyoxylate/hydroxypyruvate reductase A